jgi:hypothetical protein
MLVICNRIRTWNRIVRVDVQYSYRTRNRMHTKSYADLYAQKLTLLQGDFGTNV